MYVAIAYIDSAVPIGGTDKCMWRSVTCSIPCSNSRLSQRLLHFLCIKAVVKYKC